MLPGIFLLVQQWREGKDSERERERGREEKDKGALSNKDNEWELYGVSFKKQKNFGKGEKKIIAFVGGFLCLLGKFD